MIKRDIFFKASKHLSQKLSDMGFTGPGRGYITDIKARDIMTEVFSEIMNRIDRDELIEIPNICRLKKMKCKGDKSYILFTDKRQKKEEAE